MDHNHMCRVSVCSGTDRTVPNERRVENAHAPRTASKKTRTRPRPANLQSRPPPSPNRRPNTLARWLLSFKGHLSGWRFKPMYAGSIRKPFPSDSQTWAPFCLFFTASPKCRRKSELLRNVIPQIHFFGSEARDTLLELRSNFCRTHGATPA
jgi:hypothetical protein